MSSIWDRVRHPIADVAERESDVPVGKDEDFLILRLPDRFAFL